MPVLQVVLPLLAAPLCLLLGLFGGADKAGARAGSNARSGADRAWALAVVVSWGALAIALLLLRQVLDGGGEPLSVMLGGWAAPWGIEYRIDPLAGFMLVLVAGMAALAISGARRLVEREVPAGLRGLFYTAFLLCLAGQLGIVATGDAFNLFVFLEIASLSSYTLISLGSDRRALTSAYRYLVIGTIGATFILIGIGLLYMMTGTLNMSDLAARLPAVADSRTVRTAFAFLSVGIGIKLALFPFHLWLPGAYTYAPSVVTTFLAATATKVGVYVLLRFCCTVFGWEFSFQLMPLAPVLLVLGGMAVLSASTVAIFQDNVKRMLAYSSIAQIGAIVIGIGLANATGMMAAVLHLFNHAVMKGALFLALSAIIYRSGGGHLKNLAGMGQRMPWTAAVLVIGGLGLIGVPLTAGFISKWYLVVAALERGWWPIAVVLLAGSLIAMAYVWRIVDALYFSPSPESRGAVAEAPLSLLLPAWALAVVSLVFGVWTRPLVEVAAAATRQLGVPMGALP